MNFRPFTLLLAFAAFGCATPAPVVAPVAIAPAAVTPASEPATVTASGYLRTLGANGKLLAAITAYTSSDIHHVNLSLKTGGAEVGTVTVLQSQLLKQITFASLKQGKTYTLEAKAYDTAGETSPIDNFSVLASSCTTTFSTTTDPAVTIGNIALQLRNKTFAGSGTSALAVGSGQVVDTDSAISITVAP